MMTSKAIRNSYTIKVPSPDGTVFVHCIESAPSILEEIDINIGKAGASVSAWADGLKRVINLSLRTSPLSDVLVQISNISSDKSTLSPRRSNIRSGVDAVFYALMVYRNTTSPTFSEYSPPKVTVPKRW